MIQCIKNCKNVTLSELILVIKPSVIVVCKFVDLLMQNVIDQFLLMCEYFSRFLITFQARWLWSYNTLEWLPLTPTSPWPHQQRSKGLLILSFPKVSIFRVSKRDPALPQFLHSWRRMTSGSSWTRMLRRMRKRKFHPWTRMMLDLSMTDIW